MTTKRTTHRQVVTSDASPGPPAEPAAAEAQKPGAGHTPGEWEAMPPKKIGKHWRVGANAKLGGNGAIGGASVLYYVATIDNGAPGDTLETEEANARLIAAAPEMLQACKDGLEWMDEHGYGGPMYRTFRDAIAKATGA